MPGSGRADGHAGALRDAAHLKARDERAMWTVPRSPMPRFPLAIEATGLVKSLGPVRAVDGVDLAVRRGSVHRVLGPNGAGKTATIRMLVTLLSPDAGAAGPEYAGWSPCQLRRPASGVRWPASLSPACSCARCSSPSRSTAWVAITAI
jgi:ABC transporter